MSVSDGICQKSDIAVENSLTKRGGDVGAALNSKPKGCRNRDHVDRLDLKKTGLRLVRPLLRSRTNASVCRCRGWRLRRRICYYRPCIVVPRLDGVMGFASVLSTGAQTC